MMCSTGSGSGYYSHFTDKAAEAWKWLGDFSQVEQAADGVCEQP